jgi:outer membrane protein
LSLLFIFSLYFFVNLFSRKIAIYFIFLGFNFSISAQIYTLDTCITLALKNNFEIAQTDIQYKLAKLNHQQSYFNLLPSIIFNSGANYNIGYSISPLDFSFIEQNTLSGTASLSAQLVLFQGLQQINNIAQQKLLSKAAAHERSAIETQVKIQTITLYLQALLAERVMRISENQLEFSCQNLEKSLELIDAGLLPSSNKYELIAQLNLDEANHLKNQNQLKRQLFQLKNYIRIESYLPFELDTQLVQLPHPIVLKKADVDLDQGNLHSLIEAARYRYEAAQKALAMQKGSLLPTITLGYAQGTNFINAAKTREYRLIANPVIGFTQNGLEPVRSLSSSQVLTSEINTPILTQLQSNRQEQVMLNFSWNLFGKMSKHTQIQSTRLNAQIAKIRWQQAIQKSKEDYFLTALQLENAYSDYIAHVKILEASKTSVQIALEKFKEGLITQFELNNLIAQRQNAAINHVKSILEWQFLCQIMTIYDDF